MSENKKCVVCKNEVDWSEVTEVFEHLFDQADCRGIESLTEGQQAIIEGRCCSEACYNMLS